MAQLAAPTKVPRESRREDLPSPEATISVVEYVHNVITGVMIIYV